MAKPTEEHHRRIAEMTFSELYPLYLAKVVRKDRTKEELHAVLNWLTGFSDEDLQKQMDQGNTLATYVLFMRVDTQRDLLTPKSMRNIIRAVRERAFHHYANSCSREGPKIKHKNQNTR